MDPAERYDVEDGRFIRYTEDGTRTEVPAERGASRMIADSLDQRVISVNQGISQFAYAGGTMTDTGSIALAEGTAYDEISARPGLTEPQKFEQLHRSFGDNPTTVLVGVQMFGVGTATKIWGAEAVGAATANSTELRDEGSPSGVIQNSQSQGMGPVPHDTAGTSAGGEPGGTAGGPLGTSAAEATGAAGDSHGQGTASSPRANPRTGGDPILLANGQLCVQVTDLSVPGRGIAFRFTRTYMHRTHYRGPLGFSWDHSYNLWLREAQEIQPDGSYRNVVYRSTGEVREDCYTQVTAGGAPPAGALATYPDAAFRGPAGFFDELTKSGGVYTLRMVNGTVITYNDDLRVHAIADRSGNTLNFFYQDRRLVRVVDAVGKVFDFVDDACGRLVEVLDRTGGRRLAYTYDDLGNLVEVDVFASSATAFGTDYVYMGHDAPAGFEHNLIEVIGADGRASLEVQYGLDTNPWSFNRVLAQRSLDGHYTYEYGPADGVDDLSVSGLLSLPQTSTTVTYPSGHRVEHAFNAQGNVVRRREQLGISGGGPEDLTSLYDYNGEGLLIREQRPDGATVTYVYEVDRYEELNGFGSAAEAPTDVRIAFGNMLRRQETPRAGSGEVRQMITTWEFHPGGSLVRRQRGPFYADPTGVELPGQATSAVTYTYDASGRLARIDYGSVETATGTVQALTANDFGYDAVGNLTTVRVGTVCTRYHYFPDLRRSGFVQRRVEDTDQLARVSEYEVDDLGRITKARDPLGAEWQWKYNGFDLVIEARLPQVAGNKPIVDYVYDRMRRLIRTRRSILRADGSPHPDAALVVDYRYDQCGRLTETSAGPEYGTRRISRTVYTPSGQPRRVVDGTGVTTEFHYDPRNLLHRTRLAPGTGAVADQLFRYNRSGEIVTVTDPLGAQTRYERDGFGRCRRTIDRENAVRETEYDAAGRPIRWLLLAAAPGGGAPILWSEGSQEFDAAGRLLLRRHRLFLPEDPLVAPREIVVRFLYDELNRLVEIRRGTQVVERRTYDGLGRVVRTEDADGNMRRFDYDDAARRLTVVSIDREQGSAPPRFEYFRTELRFDQLGQITTVTDGLGNITTQVRDSRGLVERVEVPDGSTVHNDYDVTGLLLRQRHEAGTDVAAVSFEYDAAGRPTAQTGPLGDRIEFRYDLHGLLAESEGPDGIRRIHRDRAGRSRIAALPSGIAVHSSYDREGRVVRMDADGSSFSAPPSAPGYTPVAAQAITYAYAPDGRIRQVADGSSTVTFTTDSAGRVVSESGPSGTVTYQWDDAGNLTGLTFPGGRAIGYQYTPAGLLTGVTQSSPGTAYPGSPSAASVRTLGTIERIGTRARRRSSPGIAETELYYDGAARLVGVDHSAGVMAIDQLRVLRGSTGERLLDRTDMRLRGCGYDPLGRLDNVTDHAPGAALDPLTTAPAVDEIGLGAVSGQIDIDVLAGGLLAAGPAQRLFGFTHDTAGNRTGTSVQLNPFGPVETTVYAPVAGDRYGQIDGRAVVYDLDGNLLGDGVRTFRYDTFGRLCEASDGVVSATATYDPLSRLDSLTEAGVTTRHVWANWEMIEVVRGTESAQLVPGERPKQPVHVAAAGRELLPLTDDAGSVLAWLGSDGIVLGRRDYDPYGLELVRSGIDPVPLGFGGHLRSAVQGLHWLHARVYDARLGRFLQPDPLGYGDGPNVYAFARNRPGTLMDVAGYAATDIDWGTVAANAAVTAAEGVGLAVVGGLAVGAGIISGPALAAVGGVVLVGGAIYAYTKRSDEAMAAGKTYDPGSMALLSLGDTVGVSGIYEGATGRDAVTDRVFGSQERSTRLGSGIGGAVALAAGPKALRFGRGLAPAGGGLATSALERSSFSVIARDGKPVVQLPQLDIDMAPLHSAPPQMSTVPDLPAFVKGGPTSAATRGGTVVESGLHGPYPEAAGDLWRNAQESGLPLRPHGFFDNLPNLGAEGAYASTHAELKALYIDPAADFVAVNNNPCLGCGGPTGGIRWFAMSRGTPITVLAPKGFYYFLPNGEIIEP